jgi:hypothetical protein
MHETKKHTLIRYILLLLFLFFYFFYTVHKFGLENGLWATGLTWSFFVFCTPIADAGFILAFPIRILIGVKMMYTQIASFFIALAITLSAFFAYPEIFQKTLILNLYYRILNDPFPYWIIIILSLIGTIFSIYFGDELINVSTHAERVKYHKHINKYKIITSLFIFFATLGLYNFLLHQIGLKIPLL